MYRQEVLELECELTSKLKSMSGAGEPDKKLQIYKEIFKKVIDSEPYFGTVLIRIKKAYDNFIENHLLNTQRFK